MKKRNFTSLRLAKKTISSFSASELKGGWSTRTRNTTTARTVRGCD